MGKQSSKWLDFGIGTNQIHADKLPVNYTPSNYTPNPVGDETSNKLSAHLKGIDSAIKGADYYDASVPVTTPIGVGGTGYDSTHTIFTLPDTKTYDGTGYELFVLINGVAAEEGVDFNYDNSEFATTITTLTPIPENSRVRFRKLERKIIAYDASVLVTTDVGVPGTGYDDNHLVFQLPGGETYDGSGDELLVFANGVALENGIEFIYSVGSSATTVTFNSPVPKYSRIRFRKVKL